MILWYKKKYLFGLCPQFLHRAPKSLGISQAVGSTFILMRLWQASRKVSGWGLVARKTQA